MHHLSHEEVCDALLGANLLGCGGGGGLQEGLDLVQRAHDEGHAFTVVALGELADAARFATVYAVGGMTVVDDERYASLPVATEHPTVTALRGLSEAVGCSFSAVMPGEIGATSLAEAFYPAATYGLPVVDGDSVGRAVPALQHSMFCLHGLPIAPQYVVNEFGEEVCVKRVVDDVRAEAIVRALAVVSHNVVWVADHALTVAEARPSVISGTVSRALKIGRALREARQSGLPVGPAAADAGGGHVRFSGVVTSLSWEEREGFTVGEVEIDGRGDHVGQRYRIWFQNENLMAWRDDHVDATTPDLICVVDSESGFPVSNPGCTEGRVVEVLGFPAPAIWRSTEGLELLGPRAFGFDADYRGLE